MAETKDPEDLEEMLKKLKVMRKLREKIDLALEKLYKKGGFTSDDVTAYLDDPKNFTPGQFDLIRMYRKHIKEMLATKIDPETVKTTEAKEAKKAKKKRTRKSLGQRRKWIQMD